jgi:hypothetical protein
MPVEIKELVIRAVAVGERGEGLENPLEQTEIANQEAIIEECVRQVLQILKKSKER